jgi:hypothetical protein
MLWLVIRPFFPQEFPSLVLLKRTGALVLRQTTILCIWFQSRKRHAGGRCAAGRPAVGGVYRWFSVLKIEGNRVKACKIGTVA